PVPAVLREIRLRVSQGRRELPAGEALPELLSSEAPLPPARSLVAGAQLLPLQRRSVRAPAGIFRYRRQDVLCHRVGTQAHVRALEEGRSTWSRHPRLASRSIGGNQSPVIRRRTCSGRENSAKSGRGLPRAEAPKPSKSSTKMVPTPVTWTTRSKSCRNSRRS